MDARAASDDPGTGVDPRERQAPGMPRWVKVSLLTIAVLVALFLLLHLTGLAPHHGSGHMQRHVTMGIGKAASIWS